VTGAKAEITTDGTKGMSPVSCARELVRLSRDLNQVVRENRWERIESIIDERNRLLEEMRGAQERDELPGCGEGGESLRGELSALLREAFLQDRATREILDRKLEIAAEELEKSKKGRSLLKSYRAGKKRGAGKWLDFSK